MAALAPRRPTTFPPAASRALQLYHRILSPTETSRLVPCGSSTPIRLPATLDELMAEFDRLQEARPLPENLSCFSQGWSVLGLISSRHFRTPVMTAYWQLASDGTSQPERET